MREGNPVRKALALFAVVALMTAATNASAAITAADAKCRAAIQKNASKLGSTTHKAIDGCVKAAIKTGTNTDCNVSSNYDTKAKVSGARTKLIAAVGGGAKAKCIDGTHPDALAEFQPSCPSPADDDAVAGFADVAPCQADIAQKMVENVRRYILNPDAPAIAAHANTKNIQKCANAIAKNATKLWATVAKTRAKNQNTLDKAGAPDGDYDSSTFDDGKISAGVTKLGAAIQKACGDTGLSPGELGLIHTCDNSAAGISSCVATAIQKNAGGVTATNYEFAGVCPTEVRVSVNSGTTGSAAPDHLHVNNTALSTGWTGLGHEVDVHDGFVGRVNLACSDVDCESCAVTSNCEAGNCRCSNNLAIQCGTTTGPFTQDTCTVGNTCIVAFGSPLPLSAGGSPVCVVNRIPTELVGTADVGTGSSSTDVSNVARVFLGITQSTPCPTCSGVGIGGVGTCSGGANNLAPCTTDAIHPDFGNTAYECQPTLASNISGTGLIVDLTLTDGPVSLPFDDACEAPLGSLDCACGACSGNNAVGCVNDAECAGMGLGTCEKGSNGADRRPNDCAAPANCVDQGDEKGLCSDASDMFCDGYVRDGGGGIITCSTNADCMAVDSECPSGCGNCTLIEPTKCFLDPIEAQGLSGQDGAELASVFCSPPTVNVGINEAGGIPGGGRVVLDWDFTGYCPDGTTEFELGGSNCP